MNYRIVFPLLSLGGILVGLLVMLSPFFVTGGYVGLEKGVQPGSVEHLLSSGMSILLGLAIMVGSGVCAVILGVIFGIQAASRQDVTPPVQDNSDPSDS
ncbi:hypothetical protein [Bremerella sp. P1]|uniref:hypothetical protein n=1 Tax=Bremerella sp. P1 TaxID=3026424 RepID=UPI002368B1D4|nr:hypothetical protein [Bremerella sp. P1]WDI42137.1 hypothetical protein PSR63_27170 [Bremerella sp. P1]